MVEFPFANFQTGLKEKDVAYLHVLRMILIAPLYEKAFKVPANARFMQPYFEKHMAAAKELTKYINDTKKTSAEIEDEIRKGTIPVKDLDAIRVGLADLAKARGWLYKSQGPAKIPDPITVLARKGDVVDYVRLASHWLMEMKGISLDDYDWVRCDLSKARLLGKYYFRLTRNEQHTYLIGVVP